MLNKNFCENMKKFRLNKGLSFSELSKLVGVSAPTLQRYESGKIKNVPYESLLKLADVFGCEPKDLLGWSEKQAEKTLEQLYDMLSEKGQQKFIDYLSDLKTNPENINPNKFVKEIFIDGLNAKAKQHQKDLAKEIHIYSQLEK